jgi:hypothetical protein
MALTVKPAEPLSANLNAEALAKLLRESLAARRAFGARATTSGPL